MRARVRGWFRALGCSTRVELGNHRLSCGLFVSAGVEAGGVGLGSASLVSQTGGYL